MKLKTLLNRHYFTIASDAYREKHFNTPFININNGYILPLIILAMFIIAGYNF